MEPIVSVQPGSLLEVSGSYWKTCTLHAAVKLNVFSVFAGQALTAEETARALGADARATAMLLDALAAMRLLEKEGGRYAGTPASLRYLDAASPDYLGHIIMHHHHLVDSWRRLDEAVLSGRPVRGRASFENPEVRRHFLMGMFNLAMQLAPRVAAAVDLGACRRLLDLGGGPGTYAIHFCRRYAALQATVYDLPQTEPVARETIARFGMTDRIGFHAGDFLGEPLPEGFDAAWLSHILHAEGSPTCRTLIAKVFEALNPGGLILIHDFFLNDTMDGPLFPALFALNMLLGTGAGQAYSRRQIGSMLADAGFVAITTLSLDSPNDSGIIQAHKPARSGRQK